MNYIIGVLLISAPSLCIFGVHLAMRKTARMATVLSWLIVGICGAIAVWGWVDYTRQTNDVGLIVSGVLAMAAFIAAAVATVTTIICARMRANG